MVKPVKMEKGYIEAFKVAREKIRFLYPVQKVLKTFYFGKNYLIKLPEVEFINADELNDREKILILHYLSSPIPEENYDTSFISFKEIKTGNIYFPSIFSRVHNPLIQKFSNSPEKFMEKALSLQATPTPMEKYSVKFHIFPEIHVIINFYPEDEEFPSDAKVLFSSITEKIFNIEDIVIMCEEIVEKLIK
ncbi:DUF3786 domain-containing protein [bacterium]|nr:DUF3786 domain-containing protein [bacterium]